MSLINVETLIPAGHPARVIQAMCDGILWEMSGVFDEIYARAGAPSVPPETLLKGKVLQALCTVKSDRQLCARLQTDRLFRWFVDLPMDAEVSADSSRKKQAGPGRTRFGLVYTAWVHQYTSGVRRKTRTMRHWPVCAVD